MDDSQGKAVRTRVFPDKASSRPLPIAATTAIALALWAANHDVDLLSGCRLLG
jgi:hypothetical protein